MWSIRKALLLIFFFLVGAPLGMFWAWPHSKSIESEVEHAHEVYSLLARNLVLSLQRYHKDLTVAFDELGDVVAAGRPSEALVGVLSNLRLRSIWIIDSKSGETKVPLGSLPAAHAGPAWSALVDHLAARAEGAHTQISELLRAPDGTPALYLVRKAGEQIVVGTLEMAFFDELAGSIAFGARGHAVVVDRTGAPLTHPILPLATAAAELAGVPAMQRMLIGESGVTTFHSTAFKDDLLAGYASAGTSGWGVVVAQPMKELRAKANIVNQSALNIFAMGLITAALIALRTGIIVVDPLRSVIRGAQLMAKGATDVRIAEPGRLAPHEIKALAATFNSMAASIADARAREAEARKRAERASEHKSEFLRYVTHELRSPVNAILGFSTILAQAPRGQLGAPQFEGYARDIQASSKHLLSLINDLLDLSRIEAGRYEINEESFGVDEIVERCIRFIAPTASERQIAISTTWQGLAPAIRADERAMFQVILNLVSNAVRYGAERGHVEISSGIERDGSVFIEVCDDGPGISQADLERVLEPFQRVSSAANRTVQGSGLGLPIVKRLVELHGGRFLLESDVGIGTRARICLPAARHLSEACAEPPELPPDLPPELPAHAAAA